MTRFNAPSIRLPALAAAFACSVPLVAGFFGKVHPAFDSLSHFRLHLAVLLICAAIALLMARLWLNAGVAVLLALGAMLTTYAPSSFVGLAHASSTSVEVGKGPVYRLLQLNLRYDNTTPERVLSLIARTKPDIITLEEVSPMWRTKLDLIDSAYPFSIICPSPKFGVAILSRRPFAEGSKPRCPSSALGLASIDLGGKAIDIAALHLFWPWPFKQPRQIDELASQFAAISRSAILAGDFNATPWSVAVNKVAQLGGLTRIERVGTTWQDRHLPDALRPLGLPLDQVMSKGNVVVRNARTLEPVGSDHLPVLVEFSLTDDVAEPAVDTVAARMPRDWL